MVPVTLFTDPACPFAFSAEPARMRLRWLYGDQLAWTVRMIVLTREPGEAERLAEGAPGLQRKFGMPIDPRPYPRPASSEPACRAVVAARLVAPARAEALLRRLRVHTMAGGLLDDPELIARAAREAGLDAAELLAADATDALEADAAAARDPSPAARALDHKLGGPLTGRRYTAPSYEFECDGARASVPGFNSSATYETVLANLAPGLARRPAPESARELLEWAAEPLATAEVAELIGTDASGARAELSRVAAAEPVGADFYWTLCRRRSD